MIVPDARRPDQAAYDRPMLFEPWILGLVMGLVALAAIPTRRLFAAGVQAGWLASYLFVLVVLGFLVVRGLGPEKFLVPVLVVAVVAPFLLTRGTLGRLLRRAAMPGTRPAAPATPRSVGTGSGRTVRPDGTVESEEVETEEFASRR